MRKRSKSVQIIAIISFTIICFYMAGCAEKNPVSVPVQQSTGLNSLAKKGLEVNFRQFNLVSDTNMHKTRLDANLANAWGIAVTPNGTIWISANHTSLAVIYDAAGNQKLSPVGIPTVSNAPGGAPSGVVFNTTASFKLPDGNASRFIFAGEDGIISAWGPTSGSTAVVAADQSAQNTVYKGIEIAQNSGSNFLYATNFRLARIDVFDESFNIVNGMSFSDPNIPDGYAPFNIKNINGMLFVTYAKQKLPDKMDDDKGLGHGFVDIFTTAGVLVSRFATRGNLNSPWGIAVGPSGDLGNDLLIGNFGDGRINVFSLSGDFIGQLKGNGQKPLAIDGLWGLFTSTTIPAIGNKIYFTAGPNEENNGLFGYLLSKDKHDFIKDEADNN
jgi:uncharacterized protein (TIGR03118 family)